MIPYLERYLNLVMRQAQAAFVHNTSTRLYELRVPTLVLHGTADQMIRARKYADAKAVLEAAAGERPNNARVLFGLAEVTSKQASALTDSVVTQVARFVSIAQLPSGRLDRFRKSMPRATTG